MFFALGEQDAFEGNSHLSWNRRLVATDQGSVKGRVQSGTRLTDFEFAFTPMTMQGAQADRRSMATLLTAQNLKQPFLGIFFILKDPPPDPGILVRLQIVRTHQGSTLDI